MKKEKNILSLCDYSGAWSNPYKERGYNVIKVDLKHGQDVRLYNALNLEIHGILAAPPCTHFAGSGARWWKQKGEQAILDGLSIIDACMRIILINNPVWWVLENPVGRLKNWLGDYRHIFNPNEYAGYLQDSDQEAYTKKTCLWGDFNIPEKKPVEPIHGSLLWKKYGGKSERTKEMRSLTPEGFAYAFFLANP